MPRTYQHYSAEPTHWSVRFDLIPGCWPRIESTAEKENDYLCNTRNQALDRVYSRALSRRHEHKTCAQLKNLLKGYRLASSGRQAELLGRLTAHEASLVTPPFLVVTGILPFEFQQLPNEIRTMVYKELLTFKEVFWPRRVNILRVNKQIYREAKGLLYSLNTIQINIDNLNRLWLNESGQEFNIGISRKRHYLDNDWTMGLAPPNQWLKLPTYLEECENIRIVLCARNDWWWIQQQQAFPWPQQQQRFTPKNLTTMLMHFHSLVYTRLIKHKHLHTIHVELELTGEHNSHLHFTVTEEQMREFEQGCLNGLGHLRGMRAVNLKGFTCVDPFDIFLTKQAMLLPSSNWWTYFLTMPKVMPLVPQWWQITNLSVYCNPSGRNVATTPNYGGITFVAFRKPAWHSLTRGRSLIPQTHEARCYHASMSQWHLTMLASLRQPPTPLVAPATSFVHCRALVFQQALVR